MPAWGQYLTGMEIAEIHRRLADVGLYGKPGRADELLDHFPRAHLAIEMAGPDVDVDRGVIDRLEEGQADDVVVMAVAEEQIDVADTVGEQREPGLAQAGACVEDHPMFSAANFDAGSVTAVAIELGA